MTGVIAAGRPMSEAGASIETLIEAAGWAQVDDASALAARAYADTDRWVRMSILNSASGGRFSTDRTMREYNRDIWKLSKIQA